jgi:hypothetical protein
MSTSGEVYFLILFGGHSGHDRMAVRFTTTLQSVPITTKVVSSNPAQA